MPLTASLVAAYPACDPTTLVSSARAAVLAIGHASPDPSSSLPVMAFQEDRRGAESSTGLRLGTERLAEATAWRYGYLITQGGLSLLLYLALGRILSLHAFSVSATALGVVVIAQSVSDFGLSQAVLAVLPNPAALARRYDRVDLEAGVALAFLVAAAVAALLCALAGVALTGLGVAAIAVAPAAGVAVEVAGTDGLLRAEGEFRRPVVLVATSRLGAFAGVPVAASSGSATATCLSISAGSLICALPAMRLLLARLRAGAPGVTSRAFAEAAAPLGVSNAAIVASARFNTVILGGVASLRAAAVFESAWRLFQVGQYAIGGAPTAAAPFIATALSDGRRSELRTALRRAAMLTSLGGAAFAIALILARGPIDRELFGPLGPPIGRSLLWLVPVLPLSLLALLMTITLAAVSRADRRWVAIAYSLGAAVNVVVLLGAARHHSDIAGSVAATAGTVLTTLILAARLRALLRRLEAS